MKKYCFGADIGGTTMKLGLFDADGMVLDKWEVPTHTENEGEAILPDLAKTILDKIEEKKLNKEEIAGIGVDVPGPVAADGSVPHTANLGWGYKAVTKELTELTGLPCKAGNDANVAALGEMWLGGGKGHRDVLMITLGTGVGGGIVIDGQILVGAHGAGGEIGHIHVKDGEESCCGCGNKGCLEQYASATGIARLEREWLEKSNEPSVLRDHEMCIRDSSGGGDNNKNPKNRQSILMFLIIAMVAILFWNYIGSMGNSSNTITYDEFVQMLDEGKVAKVEINSGSLKITAKNKDALGREQIYTTGTVPVSYTHLEDAHSVELDPNTTHPMIHLMPDQDGIEDIGGTLRLGSYPCILDKNTKAYELYGDETIHERHRHRYEVNNDYREVLRCV